MAAFLNDVVYLRILQPLKCTVQLRELMADKWFVGITIKIDWSAAAPPYIRYPTYISNTYTNW